MITVNWHHLAELGYNERLNTLLCKTTGCNLLGCRLPRPVNVLNLEQKFSLICKKTLNLITAKTQSGS